MAVVPIRIRSRRSHIRGFSLVEIMVAMALSVLLLGGRGRDVLQLTGRVRDNGQAVAHSGERSLRAGSVDPRHPLGRLCGLRTCAHLSEHVAAQLR